MIRRWFQSEPGQPAGMIARVVANSSWLAAGNVVTALLTLAISLWMANHFGPGQYGLYAFALSVVLLIAPLAELGVNHILVRELARQDESEVIVMGSGAVLRAAGALAVCAIAALTVALVYTDDAVLRRYLLIALLALLPRVLGVFEAPLDARLESRYVVMARVTSSIVVNMLRAAALLADQSLVLFVWLTVLHACIEGAGVLAFYLRRGGRPFAWRVQWGHALRVLRAAWPLALWSVSVGILLRFDQVMLQQFLGEQAVGYYAAALLFTEGPTFIPMVICASVFPALVQVRQVNPALYKVRTQQFHDLVIWVGIVLAAGITLLAPLFVAYLLSEPYRASLGVLRILPWCTMMVAAAVAQAQYLIAEDLQWVGSLARVIGCAVNVWLNWLWIPAFGLEGAAWASLTSYIVIVLIVPGLVPSTRICIAHFFVALCAPLRYLRAKPAS